MADRAAQSIVDQALALVQTHPHAPAVNILDLAMTGKHGADPSFEVIPSGPAFDDWTDPASPFGALLRQAFGAHADVIERFAQRYGLWDAMVPKV